MVIPPRPSFGGKTFNPIKPERALQTNLDPGSRYHSEHSTLLVDGVNPTVRYYSARKKIYRSADHGTTSSLINNPWESAPHTPWVHCVVVDRATEGKIWPTAAYAGLKTANDGGATWSEVTGFNDATYLDSANGLVAVFGRQEGDEWKKIYFSPEYGSTWTEATGKGIVMLHQGSRSRSLGAQQDLGERNLCQRDHRLLSREAKLHRQPVRK